MQQDGFRYLGLTADKSMNLSPREYQNMMIGRNEQYLDQLQMYSIYTIMMRVAYHHDPKKKLKPTDLFNRDKLNDTNNKELSIEEKLKKAEDDMKLLQNLDLN